MYCNLKDSPSPFNSPSTSICTTPLLRLITSPFRCTRNLFPSSSCIAPLAINFPLPNVPVQVSLIIEYFMRVPLLMITMVPFKTWKRFELFVSSLLVITSPASLMWDLYVCSSCLSVAMPYPLRITKFRFI